MSRQVEGSQVGSITALRAGDRRQIGEESVMRGTPLGNPFLVRAGRGAEPAVEAYWRLLQGRGTAHEIGRASGIPVHESQGRVSRARMLGALGRLVARVRAGEAVFVRCRCRHAVCHAHMVREWVAREVARG